MRVCFVVPEYFLWGVYGGFGYLTKTLGSELVARGIDVSVVTQRRTRQKEVELVDGVTVYGYPSDISHHGILRSIKSRWNSIPYYKEASSDIYHSEALSFGTVIAQRAVPLARHVITFQDPYDLHEWKRISLVDTRYKLTPKFKTRLIIENRILSKACDCAIRLFSQAWFIIPKAVRLFNLSQDVGFLPNPVSMPSRSMIKTDTPTVCFLARWDPQKRVELFLELAKRFPEVTFIAMGRSHDPVKDRELREKYSMVPNLVLTGFVSEKEKSMILEKSWGLVNTSVREALPVSFLEALAHETPIISGEDPDGLTSCYGFKVYKDDYYETLRRFFQSPERERKGREGRRYVERVHDIDRVVAQHIKIYEEILEE